MRKIVCDHCKKFIVKRDDLIVTTKYLFFLPRRYHQECFADLAKMKTLTSGFVNRLPINSIQYTLLIILCTVFCWFIGLVFLMMGRLPFLILGALFMVVPIPALFIRIYSYLKYERPLGD